MRSAPVSTAKHPSAILLYVCCMLGVARLLMFSSALVHAEQQQQQNLLSCLQAHTNKCHEAASQKHLVFSRNLWGSKASPDPLAFEMLPVRACAKSRTHHKSEHWYTNWFYSQQSLCATRINQHLKLRY
jgi:hypothetical protein